MSETHDFSCVKCENGHDGMATSQAWYAGEGCNPSLCLHLDRRVKTRRGIVMNKTDLKVLDHWINGNTKTECPCLTERVN